MRNACICTGFGCWRSKTKIYSPVCAGIALPLASLLRLKPLVRIRSVLPSGLTAVEIGWSTVKSGRSGRPGFKACKVDPRAASGVMLIPVGNSSAAGTCFFCWAVAESHKNARQTVIAQNQRARRIRDMPEQPLSKLVFPARGLRKAADFSRRCFAQSAIQHRRQSESGKRQLFIHKIDVRLIVALVDCDG